MEIYADYNYYKNEYKGTMDNSSFDSYSIQASLKIKNSTGNRASSDIEEVKECMCVLTDTIYKNSNDSATLSSEKVDNYTRNYVVKSEEDKKKEYYSIIEEYLGKLGLLYGGVPVVY